MFQEKPEWGEAPKWAGYLAMDSDGCWYWFENEPYWEGNEFGGKWDVDTGRFEQSRPTIVSPKLSMEARPGTEGVQDGE